MAKKSFNQLTKAGQAARIKKIQANHAKYNVLSGLFNIIRFVDHGERKVQGANKRAFSYLVTPAGSKNNEEGLDNNAFVWVNELINETPKSKKVIDYRLAIGKKLETQKSVLAHIDYKKTNKNGNLYRDANGIFAVNRKKNN